MLRRGLTCFSRESLWYGDNHDPAFTERYARSSIWNEYYVKHANTEGAGIALLQPAPVGTELIDYVFVSGSDSHNPRLRDEGLKLMTILEPSFLAASSMVRVKAANGSSLYACIDALPGSLALTSDRGVQVHQNTEWRRTIAREVPQQDLRAMSAILSRAALAGAIGDRQVGPSLVPSRIVVGEWYVTATRFDAGRVPLALLYAERRKAVPRDWLASARHAGLPPRLAQVAALISEGLPNDEIATRLGIGRSTARRHTERVLRRLGVERRSAVAARLASGGRAISSQS